MKKIFEENYLSPNRTIVILFLIFTGIMAISLPASPWFMSASQFLLAAVFVAQGVKKEAYQDFYKKKLLKVIVLFIPFHIYILCKSVYRQVADLQRSSLLGAFLIFYLVHLLGAFYSTNTQETLAALRIKLPALLLPLFFAAIKGIDQLQKNRILFVFVLSTFVVSLISFSLFVANNYDDIREISPFIHHIQFSILAAWSVIILLYTRHHEIWKVKGEKYWSVVMAAWFIFYMFFILKALSGLAVLLAGLYYVFYRKDAFGLKMSSWVQRFALLIFPILIIVYISYAFIRFYDTEQIDPITLSDPTPWGNTYEHYPERKMLENGNYVFFFIAEDELRDVWNKRSDLDFDSLDQRGQDLKYIVIRYLTSLGMRKDGYSLQQLTDEQISHMEQGLANFIYANELSIYQRIYQIIWEIDRYRHTGDPSDHSFTQRIESIRIGTKIAAENLLFGVGTGDVKDHYHAIYKQRPTQQEDHQRIVGAHQLLNFVVAFGLAGFILIVFSLLYPAFQTHSFGNPLFSAFFLMSLVAMFGEEMLKFQAGITFFTFFYCYFVFLKAEKK